MLSSLHLNDDNNNNPLHSLLSTTIILSQHQKKSSYICGYYTVSLINSLYSVSSIASPYTHNRFTALWILSGTTRVSLYQKNHSPTHTYRGHQLSLSASSICYDPWHPPCSIYVLESFSTISLKVFFRQSLGLAPTTSYSIRFFTQSLSSFRSRCPYHHNLLVYILV